jgi:hypothetical protein
VARRQGNRDKTALWEVPTVYLTVNELTVCNVQNYWVIVALYSAFQQLLLAQIQGVQFT